MYVKWIRFVERAIVYWLRERPNKFYIVELTLADV